MREWMKPVFVVVVPAAILIIYVYVLFAFRWK